MSRVYTEEWKRNQAINATKHGLSKTRAYKVFYGMKQRCYNERNTEFIHYGKRGITICDEWMNDFVKFYEWLIANGWDESKNGYEQSIDRIDVNGHYCPENCRIIPMNEQYFNRTDTHYITIDGLTKTIKEWSDISGVSMTVINARINKFAWNKKEAVFTPARKMRKRTGDITYKGETHSLSDWSKITGIPIQTLSSRISRNFTLDEVFSKDNLKTHKKILPNNIR